MRNSHDSHRHLRPSSSFIAFASGRILMKLTCYRPLICTFFSSAAFYIPVAIAALIRMKLSAPFSEMAYLQFLVFMQAKTFLPVAAVVLLLKVHTVLTFYVRLAVGPSSAPLGFARRNDIMRGLGGNRSMPARLTTTEIARIMLDHLFQAL